MPNASKNYAQDQSSHEGRSKSKSHEAQCVHLLTIAMAARQNPGIEKRGRGALARLNKKHTKMKR
jgi:hypothetical protein